MSDKEHLSVVQEIVYQLKVRDAMIKDMVTVPLGSRMYALRETLRTNRISGAPVTENSRLMGLISLEDFIEWMGDGSADCSVDECMTTELTTLYDDDPLVLAVAKFGTVGFGRFPVINRQSGLLVGLITKGNILEAVLRKVEIEYHEEEISTYRASHIFEDIIADKVALVVASSVPGKDFDKAGQVSSTLRKTLKRLSVDPQIVRRASIASYEAEMNLVIYTDGGEISAEIRPGRLQIDVNDAGPGIEDLDEALKPGYSTAPDWVRELGFGAGMGLPNIKRCADTFSLTSSAEEGTHLSITIDMDTN